MQLPIWFETSMYLCGCVFTARALFFFSFSCRPLSSTLEAQMSRECQSSTKDGLPFRYLQCFRENELLLLFADIAFFIWIIEYGKDFHGRRLCTRRQSSMSPLSGHTTTRAVHLAERQRNSGCSRAADAGQENQAHERRISNTASVRHAARGGVFGGCEFLREREKKDKLFSL